MILHRLKTGLIALTALLFLVSAQGGVGQITDEYRAFFEEWRNTADRAESVIDANRASDAALEVLRSRLVEYREIFHADRSKNTERIETLQSQLKVLGDAPENGDEPSDIAEVRDALQTQLVKLNVPKIIAEQAHSRANGLISEIDQIIRDRRGETLLKRGPTPLNPEYWPIAWRDFSNAWSSLYNETYKGLTSDTAYEKIRANLPMILFLLAAGLTLIIRGRAWSRHAGEALRSYGGRGTGVWTFVVSLLQVALPFIGVNLLVQCLSNSGIVGIQGELLLESVPQWALIYFAYHWLAQRVIASQLEEDLIPVSPEVRVETRFLIECLGFMLVLQSMVDDFMRFQTSSPVTDAVLAFPVIAATALILARLNRIGLRRKPQSDEAGTVIAAGASRIIRLIRRVSYLLAYVAPLLAAVGYLNAAEALIYPAVLTLSLLAALVLLHRFIGDLYGFVGGKGKDARDTLLFVLTGFVLAILSLPVFALFWGARVADLTEIWANFLNGFEFGDTRISPTIFLTFVLVFAVGYVATRLFQASLRNSLLPKTRIDPGGQNAIVSGFGYLGIIVSAILAVTWAGLDLSSLAIVAGALSVGIGFGLQTIVSNFVSGIILLIERPVSKGDWIEVGGIMGYVRDISVRSTRIETFDRSDVIVPNSDLISGTVTNYTRGNTVGRVIVPVGVAYGTDPRRVENILFEIAKAHPMVLANPGPSVVFQGFGADSLDFEIRAILRDVNWVLSVKSDMNYQIAQRFEEEGIEIPFAQRDIWLRNPEALRGEVSAQQATQVAVSDDQTSAKPHLPDVSDMSDGGDADGGDGY
ncbi:DUF3772 domain-containing protein [Sulfitobacter sp.]|uniref:DUF3772 domain-containing protein n=1 Tax=Sulfitobacter sp. TaxID=1903071 RepID=UPI0040597362